MSKLTITICGCGNGAHACAALMRLKGHRVNIYSPVDGEAARLKRAHDENGGLTVRMGAGLLSGLDQLSAEALAQVQTYSGLELDTITDDPALVIPQASVIFIITPAFAHKNILRKIAPYLGENSLLVFLPSRSGLEFELQQFAPRINVIAFQTLPWSTRLARFGQEVLISATKKQVLAASIPSNLSDLYFAQLQELLGLDILRAKNFFTLSLANVGQIIHPGIMYSLFKKDPFARYAPDALPLFYQGIDEEGAERLSAMSEEIQSIARAMAKLNPCVEPDKVRHLRDWLFISYEGQIEDTSSLYSMFITNEAYAGLHAPVKKAEDGRYVPDYSTRYITEDIPYGLLSTKSIGEMLGIPTPVIDEVLCGIGSWTGYDYMKTLHQVKELSHAARLPESYGVSEAADFFAEH